MYYLVTIQYTKNILGRFLEKYTCKLVRLK
jgi:hypothetical protein